MTFKKFPTKEALSLAREHCSRGSRYTHEQVADDIHEAGLHFDDWAAAARQIQDIDPDDEDEDTLEAESHIGEVEDHYRSVDREQLTLKQLRRRDDERW